jgi:hypothetical protein
VASPTVACVSDAGIPDECPSAIPAFEAVAAKLGSITRIHIDPGPFVCGQPWPVPPTPVCFEALFLSGTVMHGWASFRETDKVAAIVLSRTRVGDDSYGPWRGKLLDFVVPPAGWVGP